MADERKRRLIIEFELPDMYVDDIPELIAEFGTPDGDPGEDILGAIGEVNVGALTVEISGEKDSDIVTVPVVACGARIEDTEPSKIDWLDDAVERLTERAIERKVEKAYAEGYDEGMADAAKDQAA